MPPVPVGAASRPVRVQERLAAAPVGLLVAVEVEVEVEGVVVAAEGVEGVVVVVAEVRLLITVLLACLGGQLECEGISVSWRTACLLVGTGFYSLGAGTVFR